MFIDMASMYFTINCKRHQYAHGFVNIRSALAGQDQLAASSIDCKRDHFEGVFRKDSNRHSQTAMITKLFNSRT